MNTVVKNNKMSDKEKDDLLKQVLGQEYYKAGNNLPILKKVIGYISDTSDIATLAEIIPVLNSALANSRVLSIISSGATVFSIILFPIGVLINITNAYQLGIKMYSYRAIAYTITAWAYNLPIPTSSPKIISNSKTKFPVAPSKEIEEKNLAWKKSSRSVIKEIDSFLFLNKISKDIFRLLLQSMSDGNQQKLCDMLMKGYENEFKDFHSKNVWKSNYSIKFPN